MIVDRIAFLISVPKCIACGQRLVYGQKALCEKCYEQFIRAKDRYCSRCFKLLSECDCSNDYLSKHFVKKIVKVFRYMQRDDNICANSLIYSLKRDNRDDVLAVCTSELASAISASLGDISDYIITNVPRRREAIVRYGIDHAALLAKSIARATGAKYVRLLKSKATRAQKTLMGKERLDNAMFDLRRDINLSHRKVLIVDDIVTTGASMGACAMLIRGLGARQIVGAALGIAYKDNA